MSVRDVPVRAEDLTVVLGRSTVLRGIDLTVRDGETVALLGANGSGKSTLVKALVGVVPAARGRASIYGHDVATEHRAVPWGRVGYVPQRVTAAAGVPATALEVVSAQPPTIALRRASTAATVGTSRPVPTSYPATAETCAAAGAAVRYSDDMVIPFVPGVSDGNDRHAVVPAPSSVGERQQ
ncbi:ATP-binding cassette domain-containing protein [Georgenia sp. SUBG003]|uniref:ATP-binding cassette domain-containing protein n=1 Tax=Georgenia sp. SUBG003 TaxID=1497974 RepID=UPI003AB32959